MRRGCIPGCIDGQRNMGAEQNIAALVDSLRKYIRIASLDRVTDFELIDCITVSEQYTRDGAKQQDITIKYRFVGCLDS
jgi:hypothetical protein